MKKTRSKKVSVKTTTIDNVSVKDWHWEEGLNTIQIVDKLLHEFDKTLPESLKLMEEAGIGDDDIAESLIEYSSDTRVKVLSEAGWTPERIYSGLITDWSKANAINVIVSMRSVLRLRWAEIASMANKISRMSLKDLYYGLYLRKGLYKVRTRLFVKVWPDYSKDPPLEEYMEEKEISHFSAASSMCFDLIQCLRKRIDHISGGLKRVFWQVRISFEDELGEERIGYKPRLTVLKDK